MELQVDGKQKKKVVIKKEKNIKAVKEFFFFSILLIFASIKSFITLSQNKNCSSPDIIL